MKNKNRNKWNKKDMKFIFTCHLLDGQIRYVQRIDLFSHISHTAERA